MRGSGTTRKAPSAILGRGGAAAPDEPPRHAEARFVILCTREPNQPAGVHLSAAARQVHDWSVVVDLADRHAVTGFVRRAIRRDRIAVPPAVEQALAGADLAGIADQMRLDVELNRMVGAFGRAGVAAILLKGPAVARAVYPDRMLRPSRDVDLAVRPDDEAAAEAALLAEGCTEMTYGPEQAHRPHTGLGTRVGAHHRRFLTAEHGAVVELHTDILQLGLKSPGEAARWRRAVPTPGLPGALMLGPEDQAVHLAVHAHKHGFNRLILLKDLDLLLRTHGPGMDWDDVARVARREGADASVWLALRMTAVLLATPTPARALALLRPPAPLRAIYALLWPTARIARLEGRIGTAAVQVDLSRSWRGVLPNLVLMGRRRERLRMIAGLVLGG